MKTYRYKNAVVNVRGEVDKERLKEATIKFLTKAHRYKLMKGREHDKG